MTPIPSKFIDTVTRVHGKTGEIWLENLDWLIAYCSDKWDFELLQPYELSFNFVAPVLFKDNTRAVLKLGVSTVEISREASVLDAFGGTIFCQLIDSEPEKGILILEELSPGRPLSTITNEVQACQIATKLLIQLQSHEISDPASYPSLLERRNELEKLRRNFKGNTGPIPQYLVKNAETLFTELIKTVRRLQLFHGDFHHYNILSALGGEWKLIDPKGLLSETAFEITPFLMNNLEGKNMVETIRNRVAIFANELRISNQRIIKWGAVQSIISLWWFIEDGLDFDTHHLEIAKAFYELSVS